MKAMRISIQAQVSELHAVAYTDNMTIKDAIIYAATSWRFRELPVIEFKEVKTDNTVRFLGRIYRTHVFSDMWSGESSI